MNVSAPTEKKIVWCAIYVRKSTEENLNKEFNSLDAQEEYCRSFIKARGAEGWLVSPEIYKDPGYSGGTMDRPGLQKLLLDARQGKFQVVVCYKYDRLSRNTRDFLHILDLLEQNGIAFTSITQAIDTTSAAGRLMRSILMDFAQFEREMIADRTRDKMSAMARKGKFLGGDVVLGYDLDREKKRLMINKKEARQIREAFHTYLGMRSLHRTAQELSEKGYRTKEWTTKDGKKKGGEPITKKFLSYTLRNPIYLGKIRHKGQLIDGEHEAIIDTRLFEDVQKALSLNYQARATPTRDRHQFLLKGLVRCAVCGSAMTPHFSYSKKKAYLYYRCVSVNSADKNACEVRSIPARSLEEFVVDRLFSIGQDQAAVAEVLRQSQEIPAKQLADKRKDRGALARQVTRLENSTKNLVDMLAQQGMDNAPYKQFTEGLQEMDKELGEFRMKLAVIDAEITQLESQQFDAQAFEVGIKSFVESIRNLEFPERKELIGLLLREVIVDGKKSEVCLGLRPLPTGGGMAFEFKPEAAACSGDSSSA